ncbi:hypothetical protein ACLOJK_005369 [Asimina triloba]
MNMPPEPDVFVDENQSPITYSHYNKKHIRSSKALKIYMQEANHNSIESMRWRRATARQSRQGSGGDCLTGEAEEGREGKGGKGKEGNQGMAVAGPARQRRAGRQGGKGKEGKRERGDGCGGTTPCTLTDDDGAAGKRTMASPSADALQLCRKRKEKRMGGGGGAAVPVQPCRK